MKNEHFTSKKSFIIYSIIILIVILLFSWISAFLVLYSIKGGSGILNKKTTEIILYIADYPKQLNKVFNQITKKKFDGVKNKLDLVDGYNEVVKFNLSGFFLKSFANFPGLRLIDQDNKIIKEWRIKPEDFLKYDIDPKDHINKAVLDTKSGSIIGVLGFEFGNTILKLDKDSNIIWKITEEDKGYNSQYFHHDFSLDDNGNIYIPVSKKNNYYDKYLTDFRDDGILAIDQNGKIIYEIYLSEIFEKNDLSHLIFGVGPLEFDPFHLNEIEVAKFSSNFWKKDDLMLSLRHRSMILIYRPSTQKVVWYKMGPWLNQHDPDFFDENAISIFGNDVISTHYNRMKQSAPYLKNSNVIYKFNFKNNQVTRVMDTAMKKSIYNTVTGGRHQWIDENTLFVEYSNSGIYSLYHRDELVAYICNVNKKKKIIKGQITYIDQISFKP